MSGIRTLPFCALLIVLAILPGCASFKGAIGLDDTYSQRLVETPWQIKSIRGAEAAGAQPLTIHFDRMSKVSGFSGCGHYTADYWIRGNRIDISRISPVSRSACDGNAVQQESMLMESLRWARRIGIEADGSLLMRARGGPPLRLVPGR